MSEQAGVTENLLKVRGETRKWLTETLQENADLGAAVAELEKRIRDAGELHLADESTIYQLQKRVAELEGRIIALCFENEQALQLVELVQRGNAEYSRRVVELERLLIDAAGMGGDRPEFDEWHQRRIAALRGKEAHDA